MNAQDYAPERRRQNTLSVWTILLIVVLSVALVALHTVHFHHRNFRQDEIFTVHAAKALSASETAQWMAINGVHPAGWRLVATAWVNLTGIQPPVVRYFSTLCTLLAFALLFRLSTDLFDYQVGLYAVFILGTLNFIQFYMHELRPYAMLVMVSIGLQLSFLRWLRRPGFKYALLFVMFGVAGLQTHYFAGYVIAAEFVILVLFVRWDRALFLRGTALFAAIGFSLTAWVLPLLNQLVKGGSKSYAQPSNPDTLKTLYHVMQIRPEAIGAVLLITAVLIPVSAGSWRRTTARADLFRFEPEWRKLVLLISSVVVLLAAFTVNLVAETVTARNLIVILPPLAILVAFGLRRLPWQAQWVLLVLIAVPAVQDFKPLAANAPNRETWQFMEQDMRPGDRVVLHIPDSLEGTQALAFYLFDQPDFPLGRDDIYHIAGTGINYPGDQFVHRVFDHTPATLRQFTTFLDDAERVWYVTSSPNKDLVQPFLDIIQRDYAFYRTATLSDPTDPRVKYTAVEYRRLANSTSPLYRFGETVELDGWTIQDGVDIRVCDSVNVETLWRAENSPPSDYGIGLVLADESGMGVTSVDAPPSSRSTAKWESGVYYMDTRTLIIPCDLSPGDYSLLIGVHDQSTAEALPVALSNGTPNDSPLGYLTTLHVTK